MLPRFIDFSFHERHSRQRLDHAPPARALQQVLGALANDESKTDFEAGVMVLAPVCEAGALSPRLGLLAKLFGK